MKRHRPGSRSWGSSEWALMKDRASWRGGRSEGLPREGPRANAPLLLASPCASQGAVASRADWPLELLHMQDMCASAISSKTQISSTGCLQSKMLSPDQVAAAPALQIPVVALTESSTDLPRISSSMLSNPDSACSIHMCLSRLKRMTD